MNNKKTVLYFAIYVNVDGYSRQYANDLIAKTYHLTHQEFKDDRHEIKLVVIPGKQSKIELLYPTPVLSKEDIDLLYDKYKSLEVHQKRRTIIQMLKGFLKKL